MLYAKYEMNLEGGYRVIDPQGNFFIVSRLSDAVKAIEMINTTYQKGKEDKANEIRAALDI